MTAIPRKYLESKSVVELRMVRLMDEIELARKTFNPSLHLTGYFLSKVANRSKTQETYRQMLAEAFGEQLVLKTVIPVQATFEARFVVRLPWRRP